MKLWGKVKAAMASPQSSASFETVYLRQGTQIPIVNVDSDFITEAQRNYPREPRLGHRAPVACGLSKGKVLIWHEGKIVAELDSSFVPYYIDDFQRLARQGRLGLTDALIKWEGSKSPHALALNWGSGAQGGGIL